MLLDNPHSSRPRRRAAALLLASLVAGVIGVVASGGPAHAVVNASVTSSGTWSGGSWGGATGNGSTNDRAAIQSTIDYVAANGGGTVTVPGGTASSPRVFLTGDITVKSNVTLTIAQYAVVKQSTNAAHYAHDTGYGRWRSSGVAFDIWADYNYPLIHAINASNVKVNGAGKIQMSWTGDDSTSIILHVIGFNKVNNFEISGVTIDGATGYNIALRNSDNGTVNYVTTTGPQTYNNDGVSIMNTSNVTVHHNNLTTLDDGIYVWASYQDPRGGTWWDTNTLLPSRNIEIYNNTVNNLRTEGGTFGFALFGWTACATDPSAGEISNVYVHDNTLLAPYPVGALYQDLYCSGTNRTPTKDLRFANNTLTKPSGFGGSNFYQLDGVPTTNLTRDNSGYNFAQYQSLINRDFDGAGTPGSLQARTSFWSVEGSAGTDNAAVGQVGGNFGYLRGSSASPTRAALYQGVYLQPGTYTFSASAQSSGASTRMFAIRGSDSSLLASTSFTNTAWQQRSVQFTATTAGVYRVGIDSSALGSNSANYARIDGAQLARSNTCPCSFWATGDTPGTASSTDAAAVALGVRFSSTQAGKITGIRFYKGAANTGTHVGKLWSASGTQLASGTFSGESASGWQTLTFTTPVTIAAGTTYVASYHTTVGRYAVDNDYFTNNPRVSLPLTATTGVYGYGGNTTFPTSTYQNSNYWVDVVYATS